MLKCLTVWITKQRGKFLKRWEYQTTLPASWEMCMQVKKQQLELDIEQWTCTKLGKGYVKAVCCHSVYWTYMQGTSQRRQWHPTPALLPGKSHGRRSLEGCSPWGRWGLDTTERLHFHFSLSCIGEGNGNPLQCSCLENPRDGDPGGLLSMGSHKVGHDWSDLAAAAET